ncbi:signal recognition particle-docking protein FtsY [Nannocystis bainbridge]|uniref:Signal recognition particle-docking protein FtsY n=1 Tax=Nannocystis bainbridge TaxID=2995303 RepID=A0ABT5EDN0_9BACT|nr:signal recognition particle-docking protein FtsY [Nannocystis bainbridge]MDC0722942.1 signal recognition particle-docking protein FtsY [Nannocystis bainbridge]
MTSTEIYLLLAILGVLVVTGGVVLARRRALPPAKTPAELTGEPPARALEGATRRAPEVPVRPLTAEELARAAEQERYVAGLARTRGGFVAKLARLFRGRPRVSAELREEVESVLFTADIGAKAAQKLLEQVTDLLDKSDVADADKVWAVIRTAARQILAVPADPLDYSPNPPPYVLLMIGVNGVGKTTTLGKLAAFHKAAGRRVLLVAGDTFRAAAGEQLEIWARRVGCEIHLGKEGADPSSVIHDGIARGAREGFDVVLCDTAGRLHTKKELMDELQKIRRSCAKALARARGVVETEVRGPHDTFLVLDATIGQNALAQAVLFKETMDFTGLVLTKLDGTAKGGVVLGVCDELRVPVRFIGIGEKVDDLRPFDADAFVEAMFGDPDDARA